MTVAPGKALARMRAQSQREADRAKLAELRGKLKSAQARKRKAMKDAQRLCRRLRKQVSAQIESWRASELARIRGEAQAARAQARQKCTRRKCVIRDAGGGLIARQRKLLQEERAYQAQLKRLAGDARARKARTAATARERRAESDDYVRGNLPAELVPVFNRVRRSLKAGPRTTRTEAFLQWAEEHPGEVLQYQAHDADREVARLVAEHEGHLAAMNARRRLRYSELPPAPF